MSPAIGSTPILNKKNARFRMLRSTSIEIESIGDFGVHPKIGLMN
jgi:hypothetical protein